MLPAKIFTEGKIICQIIDCLLSIRLVCNGKNNEDEIEKFF